MVFSPLSHHLTHVGQDDPVEPVQHVLQVETVGGLGDLQQEDQVSLETDLAGVEIVQQHTD